jgi:hypothetical protein
MQSSAKTVDEYLRSLPADRRAAIEAVRDVVNRSLDAGIEEGMSYGMIGWYVPHCIYPAGYHVTPSTPLPFAGLASQKNHMALYLMNVYAGDGGEARFRREWATSGKKLDMGKSCVRFKRVDDLALDVIADAIRRTPVREYIASYEKAHAGRAASRASAKPAGRVTRKKTAKAAGKKRSAAKAGKGASRRTTTARAAKKK